MARWAGLFAGTLNDSNPGACGARLSSTRAPARPQGKTQPKEDCMSRGPGDPFSAKMNAMPK